MHIVVLVKVVPDSEARISVQADGKGLGVEDKHELNYFDELAVEEALRIKEQMGEVSVTAITCGPKRSLEALRKAVAMGVDEAIHVEGPDAWFADALDAAKALAVCIQDLKYDVILCGRKATDDDGAQVGPMVAELLGIPHISAVLKVEISPERDSLTAVREYEGGKESLQCRLPALLAAQKGLNEPRIPTIQGVMKGMRLQPKKVTPSRAGLPGEGLQSRWKILEFSGPNKRARVKILKGSDPASKAKDLMRILREELGVIG